MRPQRSIVLLLVLFNSFAGAATAQELTKEAELPRANQILDSSPHKSQLPCFIDFSENLRLDLLFRYTEGFAIGCRLGTIITPGTELIAFLRITPRGGKPVLMTEEFDMPPAQKQDSAGMMAAPSQLEITASGGFAAGPGEYSVEIVLTDEQGHTFRKQKNLKPFYGRGDRKVPFSLQPGEVVPLMDTRWNGALARNGPRLTVFLDAYGQNGSANLHGLDRAALMQSLFTLLTQLPCRSVKLIAFDLEGQKAIFSQERFDARGFAALNRLLKRVDFSTISYRALQSGAWSKFLTDQLRSELASEQPADDIIFLGAWGSHVREKLPQETVRKIEIGNTHVFYFELFAFPDSAPDGIGQLTKDLRGTVFAIQSPDDFAQAIKKVSAVTDPPSKATHP
jgi:hypothetical protein